MSRRFRRIMFYFFTAIFLLTTPIIILYAYGYKYDFERKRFIETGAIYIKSQPKKAAVFINNKLINKQTPVLIKGLLPNKYSIKITLDGFIPWSKELEVNTKLVTNVENILLFPLNPSEFLLNEEKFSDFYISTDKERILYARNNEIWVQELKKNSAAIQVVEQEPLKGDIKNISWSLNSKYFIFQSNNEWLLADIQKPTALISLNSVLGNEITNLKWSTKDSDNIYFLRNKEMHRFEWRSKTSIQVLTNIVNYDIYNNLIYYTSSASQFIYQANLDGQNSQQITFNNPENFILNKIQISSDGIIIIYDKDENVYSTEDGVLKLIASGVKKTEFSPDGKKLLIQTNYEMFIRYLDNIEGAPNHKKNEQILITRYSEPIKKSAFLPVNYEYVIFEVNGTIKITEIDNRNHQNIIDLTQGNNFEVAPNNETFGPSALNVYYTNKKGLNGIEVEL